MSNQSFDKSARLLTAGDFSYLKSDSMRKSTRWVRAYFKPGQNSDQTRIGISVSKKVGNAVRRNRLKRLIRDYFRRSGIRSLGVDTLLIVSPQLTKEAESKELADKWLLESLAQLFTKMKAAVEGHD